MSTVTAEPKQELVPRALPEGLDPSAAAGTGRLLSLDVFRGLTIAGMILVNNPGNGRTTYWPLLHAAWDGWTPTDLVFPFFLYIVGVSMTFSFARRRAEGASRSELFAQVLRRTLIIFALGLFLNGFPLYDLAHFRIPGVLQRIAVCYLCAAAIYLTSGVRGQIAWAVALGGGYWALMTLVPVPGHGAGVLAPETNLAAWIDNTLMHGHLYRTTWDPEGILSTLPAIASVLAGVLAGHGLRSGDAAPSMRAGLLFARGLAGIALGLVLDFNFPINKSLWTTSYAIFTAGAASVLLAACYWAVDVAGVRFWTKPFVVFGSNAIAVYVLSGLLGRTLGIVKAVDRAGNAVTLKTLLYESFFAPLAGPYNASLLWALAYVLLWLGVMWIFYARRIFVKV